MQEGGILKGSFRPWVDKLTREQLREKIRELTGKGELYSHILIVLHARLNELRGNYGNKN